MKQFQFIKDRDENGKESISVTHKPKRKLDLIPRLLCLLIAAVIWLWMVNFNDTDVSETMVLDIQIVGIESLENNGMMIYGLDKKEITVSVRGSNRDLKKYKKNEYKVVVDVSNIREVGQHTLPLSITTPEGSSLKISESEILNVSFYADYTLEKTIPLTVVTPNVLDQGFVKYSYEHTFSDTSSKTITIKGAREQIKNIDSARFNVDGSFALTEDQKTFSGFMPTFYDVNLVPVMVAEGAITECSTENIEIVVKAMEHKTVPVYVNNDTQSAQSVEIWGAPSIMKTVNECRIVINDAMPGSTVSYTITKKDFPAGVFFKENTVITIDFKGSAE